MAESCKELLQGGYHVKFVDPIPDSLQCPICLSLLKQPHLLSCCGSHMCESCIGQIRANRQPCPCCREQQYSTLLNKGLKGKILGLKVQCNQGGCDWKGELGDLERHISNKCLYVKEVCPNGCGHSCPRHLLQTHRLEECSKLPLQVQFKNFKKQFTQEHKLLQQWLVQQEKKHEEDKKELQQQLAQQEKKHKELQQQLVQQANKHEEDKRELQQKLLLERSKHTMELQQQLAKQENYEKKLQEQLAFLEDQIIGTFLSTPVLASHTTTPPCAIVINNFAQHKANDDTWYSPLFYSGLEGYGMCLSIDANGEGDARGTHVSAYIHLTKGEYDDTLAWPYIGTVTYQIMNWKDNTNDITLSVNFSSDAALTGGYGKKPKNIMNGGWGHPNILPHSKLDWHIFNNTMCFIILQITV